MADKVVLAVPLAPVATDLAPRLAKPPRTVLRSTSAPGTPAPVASRTVTVTLAGLALVMVLDEIDTVTEASEELWTCNTT